MKLKQVINKFLNNVIKALLNIFYDPEIDLRLEEKEKEEVKKL